MNTTTEYNIIRQEAANIMGVSLRSIDRYALSGRLKYKKVKGRVLFNEEDLRNLKVEKGTELFEEVTTSFDFKKEQRENEAVTILNHDRAEEKQSGGYSLMEYVKCSTERDMYKYLYENTLNELKVKQVDLERINFKVGELTSKQNMPLLEVEKGQETIRTLKKQLVDNERVMIDIRDELSFQKFMKGIFVGLLIVTIATFSLWYIYNFRI